VVAVAGEEFIHRIVQHLADAVVERALVGAADIHARFFAHGVETFEGTQVVGGVVAGLEVRCRFGDFWGVGFFGGRFCFVWHQRVWFLVSKESRGENGKRQQFFPQFSRFFHRML